MKATYQQTLIVFSLICLVSVATPGSFLHLPQGWRITLGLTTALLVIVDYGIFLAAPHTLVGLALGLYYGFGQPVWTGRALEVTAHRRLLGGGWNIGAQTHGLIIFYADERNRSYAPLRAHERVHVEQGRRLGPLYVLLYGISYVYGLAKYRNHRDAYWNVYFERKARDFAGH